MNDKPTSLYWKNKTDSGVDIVVYTENLEAVKKLKIEPSAMYFNTKIKGKQLFAYHYICQPDSDKLKMLFNALGLTDKDEKKQKRHRRTKAEMEAARAAETGRKKGSRAG